DRGLKCAPAFAIATSVSGNRHRTGPCSLAGDWRAQAAVPRKRRTPASRRATCSLRGSGRSARRTASIARGPTVSRRRRSRSASALTRLANLDAVVRRALTGHVTEEMQRHYSTVGLDPARKFKAHFWEGGLGSLRATRHKAGRRWPYSRVSVLTFDCL